MSMNNKRSNFIRKLIKSLIGTFILSYSFKKINKNLIGVIKMRIGEEKALVEKNSNGTYRIRVYEKIEGKIRKRNFKTGIKSKKEAKKIIEENFTNAWDLDVEFMTLEELYKYFRREKEKRVCKNTLKGYDYDFKRCKKFHKERFKELRTPQLEKFINELPHSDGTKDKTKFFLGQLYDFAIRMEYVTLNKAQKIMVYKKQKEKKQTIFTEEEIKKLWKYIKMYYWIDVILIMIHTGYRIGEMMNIKKEDVDLLNKKIRGGNKTNKGKNREIPISEEIYDLVENRYQESKTDYLIDNKNWRNNEKPIRENYFREQFYKIMNELEMEHKPHDTRKTLATLLIKNNVNESIILDIMGHTKIDTTQKYYIQNEFKTLEENMKNLINFREKLGEESIERNRLN